MKSLKVRLSLLLAILLAGLVLLAEHAPTQAQAGGDGPLVDLGTFVGRFDVLMIGVGTEHDNSRTITVNFPGEVEAAYLFWTLRDRGVSDKTTITLNINGVGESITADRFYQDRAYGPISNPVDNYVYVKDVTAQISALPFDTNHILSIDGADPNNQGAPGLRYGYGIVIVHEDPLMGEEAQAVIDLKEGLDYLYWRFNDPIGSPSSINCSFFTADQLLDDDGQIEVKMFAAGVQSESGDESRGFRPNNLYYQTGFVANESALPPADDITGTGTQIIDPFYSRHEAEWDTYTGNFELPAGDNYICFQLESPETGPIALPEGGASILWLANSLRLSYDAGTAVILTEVNGNDLQIGIIWPMIFFILLMSATLYFGLLKQRR